MATDDPEEETPRSPEDDFCSIAAETFSSLQMRRVGPGSGAGDDSAANHMSRLLRAETALAAAEARQGVGPADGVDDDDYLEEEEDAVLAAGLQQLMGGTGTQDADSAPRSPSGDSECSRCSVVSASAAHFVRSLQAEEHAGASEVRDADAGPFAEEHDAAMSSKMAALDMLPPECLAGGADPKEVELRCEYFHLLELAGNQRQMLDLTLADIRRIEGLLGLSQVKPPRRGRSTSRRPSSRAAASERPSA
eukprot:CAMPEP_0178384050 /NCGR_PEP_ID=MMETSP0689_2-20121128/7316_1 /TAXON_ID=160604 /ORGANISM="Amphidinium massartii, Strain CS-259" /LENGTH=249 /DNA_ID=CAMNT_0020004287 /DNA_START=56 /DNA_END=802 /DNA_ORIENTATION=+